MGLTATTPALHTNLTTVPIVRQELELVEDDDPSLGRRIAAASRIIEQYCSRSFGREVYQETLAGYGDLGLMLGAAPVVSVTSILYNSDLVTDYTIDDAAAGILYRRNGWTWTAPMGWSLDYYRPPDGELLDFTVNYTAGFLLPEDDVVADTISVAAGDNSFNRSSGVFPLLVAGDRLVSEGFTTAANNGTFTVVGRTATKIVVSGGVLVDEAVNSDPRSLLVRTLPEDIELAAIELVKFQFYGRFRDPAVASKSVGGLSLTYRGQVGLEGGGGNLGFGMNPSTVALLRPWRRLK